MAHWLSRQPTSSIGRDIFPWKQMCTNCSSSVTDLIYLLSHDGNVIPKKHIAANAILCDGAANLLINQPPLIGLVSPTPPAVRLNVVLVYMSPTRRFLTLLLTPKDYSPCDFNQFGDDIFEKNLLFCIPYLGPKMAVIHLYQSSVDN